MSEEFVNESGFLDGLARILAADVELRQKVGSRKLTAEEIQQEHFQQQESLKKLIGTMQQTDTKGEVVEGEDKNGGAQSIDIAQLLQLMPRGTNAPPPYVSEVAIYASSLLKNLSLAPSAKLKIAKNEGLMKEVVYLIIDISAGGWSQYNALSICRNLLNSEQNKEEISRTLVKIPHFLNYLVGMASIHRVIRIPTGQLLIHTEAQRVVALLSQLDEDIVHLLIVEGAVRCICNYYLEQSSHSNVLKLEAIKSLERMFSVMDTKEIAVSIHFCQEGSVIVETIVCILQDEDSSISSIGYKLLTIMLPICDPGVVPILIVALQESNIINILNNKEMDTTVIVQFVNKFSPPERSWFYNLVEYVKSWMYPNVNK